MADKYDSRVDVLYVYKYLHDALDGDYEYLAQQISDLSASMAKNFKSDTGITVGEALGWDKTRTVIISGQSFNMTDAEIVELYMADAPDGIRLEALLDYLADAVDGERVMDFNLDEWRTENRRKFVVMEYIPADDDERKFIEREGFDALDNDDEPETGSRGYFDPSFSFDTLADANKCAAELIEQGSVGVWIDVLKPDGDDWTADYYIETHKGETR